MAGNGKSGLSVSRRTMLIGGGATVGLALAWAVWPRRYPPNLVVREGERLFNAFLKIGIDGRVQVAVPQAEMGQGVFTGLPQILADELGADWKMVGVEPAPIHPAYVNMALIDDAVRDSLPEWLQGVGRWVGAEVGRHYSMQLTGGSSSVRAFMTPLREAGAMARTLLCQAAAARWGVDWRECRAEGNRVLHGKTMLGFGALAAEAAELTPPTAIALRDDSDRKLIGRALPRLDVPSKVDGSAMFGADVRLPDMVFASVRAGPPGGGRLVGLDLDAARGLKGLITVVDTAGWVAAVGTNWWAADRALALIKPRFSNDRPADDKSIDTALRTALKDGGKRLVTAGNPASELTGGGVISAEYAVPPVTHAAMETLTATARFGEDSVEVWVPTQSTSLTRMAVAGALGLRETSVTIYPTLLGGGFGRKIESDAAVQAAIIARRIGKPVQLIWSRAEDSVQGAPRPPARARLSARLGADKRIAEWQAVVAAPSTSAEFLARMFRKTSRPVEAESGAVEGAVPPYNIPALAIAHAPADIGFPTGIWRSVAHSYTAFFTECFVDELAVAAGVDPLAFRLRLLSGKPRHAEVLKTAASLGGYAPASGESAQGLAIHECFGSIVAMLAEVEMAAGSGARPRRIVAAVDCGRIVNPELVRQQIEGGILWGMAAALGGAQHWAGGLPEERSFDGFGLPFLSDTPEIEVHLIENGEDAGGVGEIAVPPVAPALANALFVATGERFRSLPLGQSMA